MSSSDEEEWTEDLPPLGIPAGGMPPKGAATHPSSSAPAPGPAAISFSPSPRKGPAPPRLQPAASLDYYAAVSSKAKNCQKGVAPQQPSKWSARPPSTRTSSSTLQPKGASLRLERGGGGGGKSKLIGGVLSGKKGMPPNLAHVIDGVFLPSCPPDQVESYLPVPVLTAKCDEIELWAAKCDTEFLDTSTSTSDDQEETVDQQQEVEEVLEAAPASAPVMLMKPHDSPEVFVEEAPGTVDLFATPDHHEATASRTTTEMPKAKQEPPVLRLPSPCAEIWGNDSDASTPRCGGIAPTAPGPTIVGTRIVLTFFDSSPAIG